ncbi:MAG: helix-turn-helix domain-containing protein, partial [Rhodospirillales bacterium]|nr:helix-turn-helix domain-containing protein [Rhodospirillales bacterium]
MNSEKTFTERLRIAASLVGGQIQLADKANVPRRTFADYIAGQTEPGRDRLVSIADAAAVNIDWLAAGRGPMRLAARTAAELTGLVRPLRQPLGEGGGQQL